MAASTKQNQLSFNQFIHDQKTIEKYQNANRILVIGPAGSGKTYVSQMISEKRSLPIIHLDQYFHQPNWEPPDMDEWKTRVADLAQSDKWVMDGNYNSTMTDRLEKADFLIWLNLSRSICILRTFLRTIKYWRAKRPECAEGCYERFDWEFIKFQWTWHQEHEPKVRELLAESETPQLILKSRKEVGEFLVL